MTDAKDLIRNFYARLAAGDAPGALALMADDIEWNTMWHYRVCGRGPQAVAEGVLVPLVAEWSRFSLEPTEFIQDGNRVVSLGTFNAVHDASGKSVSAAYSHIWEISGDKIQRFRQYIDTRVVAEARL